MSTDTVKAQSELTPEATPKSVDEVLAGLKGFGIEEFEDILTIESAGRKVQFRISNIASDSEMEALLATEGLKGYVWVQRIKCEILSRAISWINGINIRDLEGAARVTEDPTEPGTKKDIQVVLRNLLMKWGEETLNIIWKVMMVHTQAIEDRMIAAFPDAAILTNVERRILAQAIDTIEQTQASIIEEQVRELNAMSEPPETPAAPPKG